MKPATSSSGFTLLEILVALVVFGLLMIGLTQGVQFGLHARDVQSHLLEARGDLETTDRVLRNLFEQMDPGSADRPAMVVGTAHGVSFATTLPNGADALSEQQIEATLLVDASHRLLLRWTPRPHAIRLGPPPRPNDNELLTDVNRIDVAYWQTNGGGWVDSWNRATLPGLVRIRIVFQKGDPRHWPEIIVAPMRQQSGA